MIFSQNLFRRLTPTSIALEFHFKILCVGAPPQLALPVEIGRSQFHYVGPTPQLALPVEIHFESMLGPTPTCTLL